MSYLTFKEKMNEFKNDEFKKRNLFDQLQVFFVAGFWVTLTAGLLYYDYSRKQSEQVFLRVPTTPNIESISKSSMVSNPPVGSLDKP